MTNQRGRHPADDVIAEAEKAVSLLHERANRAITGITGHDWNRRAENDRAAEAIAALVALVNRQQQLVEVFPCVCGEPIIAPHVRCQTCICKQRDELQNELDRRVNRPPQEQEKGWQPIEGAPKNGTEVLIRTRNGYTWIARWERNEEWKTSPGALWTVFSPTHWMPLPDPPDQDRGTLIPGEEK